jgi:hypothetical protein
MLPEIGQMLGNVDLPLVQDALKVANAERRLGQQIKNAQPCLVAQALINVNQFHEPNMPDQ